MHSVHCHQMALHSMLQDALRKANTVGASLSQDGKEKEGVALPNLLFDDVLDVLDVVKESLQGSRRYRQRSWELTAHARDQKEIASLKNRVVDLNTDAANQVIHFNSSQVTRVPCQLLAGSLPWQGRARTNVGLREPSKEQVLDMIIMCAEPKGARDCPTTDVVHWHSLQPRSMFSLLIVHPYVMTSELSFQG